MAADEILTIRVRIQDARRSAVEIAGVAGAVGNLERQTELAGRSMDRATRRGFLMNQALFTLRRLAYGATLALGAVATGATVMGLRFNASMEMNRVAFKYFMGSVAAANKELDFLYDLAAKTPFEFPQLVDAARKFMAFGFNVKQSNTFLEIIGDTAAGLGLGADAIDRMVLAFGQMSAAGRVLGGEMRQLEELGIPARRILREQLGLTREQVGRIGELHLKSEVAIVALMRGMQKEFGGLAALQAKTFTGQMSTLHDYVNRFLGDLTFPLFERLRKNVLPRLLDIVTAMGDSFKAGGADAMFQQLDMMTGQSGRLYRVWVFLRDTSQDLATIVRRSLWPAFKTDGKIVLGMLIPGFLLLGQILNFAAHHTTEFALVLKLLGLYLILNRTYLIGNWFWTRRLTLAKILERKWTRFLWIEERVLAGSRLAGIAIMRAYVFWQVMITTAFTRARLASFALTAQLWLMNFAFLANPVVLIIVAIIALIVILGVLYWKWNWFHEKVNAVASALWQFFGHDWRLILLFIVAPFAGAVWLIMKHFDSIKAFAKSAIDFVVRQFKRLHDILNKIPGINIIKTILGGVSIPIPLPFDIPFLAGGGQVTRGGGVVVGDRGPEILRLPAGASVEPLSFGQYTEPVRQPILLQLLLDGEVVAQRSAEIVLDKMARR